MISSRAVGMFLQNLRLEPIGETHNIKFVELRSVLDCYPSQYQNHHMN